MEFSDSDARRFWDKVDEKNDGCWVWQASTRSGYGAFKIDGKVYSSHRISYQLRKGEIPENALVLHHCDCRKCVNPEHLYLGDYTDNLEDRIERTDWSPADVATKGEDSDEAVLCREDVRKIRDRAENGETHTSISNDFPVTRQHISAIVNRKKWKHI